MICQFKSRQFHIWDYEFGQAYSDCLDSEDKHAMSALKIMQEFIQMQYCILLSRAWRESGMGNI